MREALLALFREHQGLPFRTITVFNYLLEAAVFGGLLILLLLVVRRFFRRQLGSRAVYAAWLLVAVRLLVPLAIPNPVMDELGTGAMTDQAARPVAAQVRAGFRDAALNISQALDPEITLHSTKVHEEVTTASFMYSLGMYTAYGWTGKWLFFLYAAGAMAAAARMIAQNVRFRRRLKRSLLDEPGPEIMAEYRWLCREMKLWRAPDVRLADPLPSACLVGFFRPVIAVSAVMPEEDMRLALRHELAHYRVRDHWWSLLRNLCCCVQWFNPLVWVGAYVSRQDGELACDERVTAGMDDEERRAYAQTLLHAAARRNAPGLMVCATGMTAAGKRLRQRLTAILKSHAVRRGVVAGFAAVSVLIAVSAFCTAGTGDANVGGMRVLDYLLIQSTPAVNELLAPTPIASAQDARQALMNYLRTGSLNSVGFVVSMTADQADICAMPSADGWYVSLRTNAGVTWARLDHDGRMVAYNGNILREEPQIYRGERPWSIDEAVESVIRRFAVGALGTSEIMDYQREGLYTYGMYGIIARCAALLDGEPYTFDVRLDTSSIIRFEKSGLIRTETVTPLEAYREMTAWMVSELRWDGTPRGVMATIVWDDEQQRLLGVVSIVPRLCGEATGAEIVRRYGEAERHTLLLSFDPQSGAVTGAALMPEEPYTAGRLDREETVELAGPWSMIRYDIVGGRWLTHAGELVEDDTLTVISRIDPVREGLILDMASDSRELLQVRYHRADGTEALGWIQGYSLREAMQIAGPEPEPVPEPMTISIRGETRTIQSVDKHLTNRNFDPPTDTSLRPEDAIVLALEACMDGYGLPLDELLSGNVEYGFKQGIDYVSDDHWAFDPYWQLDFGMGLDVCEVYVRDSDGTVLRTFGPGEGNG